MTSHPVGYEEMRIPVPWGHIAGKWWGPRDVQPIIALHGWQDNAGSFDNLMSHFLDDDDISFLCIEMPGHGFSSPYPPGQYYYIFWDGVHILRRLVKHFKWERISILGHSMGGGIGFLYAAIYPNDVDKLITLDIASPAVHATDKIVTNTADHIDKFLRYEKVVPELMPSYTYEEMVDVAVEGYKGSVTRKSCETMLKRGMVRSTLDEKKYVFTRDVRLKYASHAHMSLDQALDYAKHIRCEVLNIRAHYGLSIGVPEYYDRVLEQIKAGAKRFQLRWVEGTHHVHLNDPDRVAGIIGEFIKSS